MKRFLCILMILTISACSLSGDDKQSQNGEETEIVSTEHENSDRDETAYLLKTISTFDSNDNPIYSVEFSYDETGKKVSSKRQSINNDTTILTQYSYDNNGKLIGIVSKIGGSSEPNVTIKEELFYDKEGRLVERRHTDASEGELYVNRYEDDLLKRTDLYWADHSHYNGYYVYEYDKNSLIKSEKQYSKNDTLLFTVNYFYDEDNNLIKEIKTNTAGDTTQKIEYFYENNLLVKKINIAQNEKTTDIYEYVENLNN